MFDALPPGSSLDTPLDRAVGLQQSVNSRPVPLVGVPGACQAHIVSVCENANGYGIYVIFTPMVDEAGATVLRAQSEPIPLSDFPARERMAMKMVEEYGFVMESVELMSLTGPQRVSLMRELPFSGAAVEQQMTTGVEMHSLGAPGPSDANLRSSCDAVSTPVVQDRSLGIPPEEAIASLGRLLAIF